jgi:hypothetical protein
MKQKLKYFLLISVLILSFSKGHSQNLWGFFNKQGETVIPAKFEDLGDFSNGLAPAKLNGKWGYINTNGDFIIQPIYSNAEKFINGYGKVSSATDPLLFEFVNTDGKVVAENEITGAPLFFDGLKIIKVGSNYGYADAKGKIIIPATYDEVKNFNGSGLAIVGLNKKYGIINKTGKIIYPIEKPYIGAIIGGYFGATNSSNESFIYDSTGQYKKIPGVEAIFETIEKERLVVFLKDYRFGLLSINGEVVYPPTSEGYIYVDNGLFFVKQNYVISVLSCKNPKVVLHSFPCTSPVDSYSFKNGFARFQTPDLKTGILDIYGNIIIPAINYKYFSNDIFCENLVRFGLDRKDISQSIAQSNTSSNKNGNGNQSTTSQSNSASGNFSSSSYALDIFSELGSMALYVGSTMYVVKIKGKTMGDQATVAARAAQVAGVRSNYKYQWFSGKNCVTLKSQYSSVFTIYCNGEIDLGK